MHHSDPPPSGHRVLPPWRPPGGVVLHQTGGGHPDDGQPFWGALLRGWGTIRLTQEFLERHGLVLVGAQPEADRRIAATTLPAPPRVIDHTDRDDYEFWLNGERLHYVFQAMPEDGWIKVFAPTPKRMCGRVEAVHKVTGVVRRTEWR